MAKLFSSILVFGSLWLVLPVQGQSSGAYVDIGPCMAMDKDQERYACYDRLEAQVRAARTRENNLPVVSLPRNSRQTQTSKPSEEPDGAVRRNNSDNADVAVADFGREADRVEQVREKKARVMENTDGDQELTSTIEELQERVPGQWQLTLANGQVWTQVNSKRYRLREGMEVRIYPSPFGGSFRLQAKNVNGFIQVERVE